MIDSLSSWLDAAARHFAHQEEKLRVFHERQVYSEYWVQSELSTLLPWEERGIFIVDCGPPLVLPADVFKYPDFVLRFGDSSENPLYFIELKDLLTNAARNAVKLREESSVMAKFDRNLTIERWRSHVGKASAYSTSMINALESAPIAICGLAVGARGDVPDSLPGFKSELRPISSNWTLGFYELSDADLGREHKPQNTAEVEEAAPERDALPEMDVAIARCLEAARDCERERRQIAPELAISTVDEVRVLIGRLESVLRVLNPGSNAPVVHAKPWIWTAASTGKALTRAGEEYGVEVRFSYNQRPVR